MDCCRSLVKALRRAAAVCGKRRQVYGWYLPAIRNVEYRPAPRVMTRCAEARRAVARPASLVYRRATRGIRSRHAAKSHQRADARNCARTNLRGNACARSLLRQVGLPQLDSEVA